MHPRLFLDDGYIAGGRWSGDSLEWNSAPDVQPGLSMEVGYGVSGLVRVDSLE